MAEQETFVAFRGSPVSAGAWLAWVLGSGLSESGELAGCISFRLGIGKCAFQVSSQDSGFSCGGARAVVPRSVLARFEWSRSLGLDWPGLRS